MLCMEYQNPMVRIVDHSKAHFNHKVKVDDNRLLKDLVRSARSKSTNWSGIDSPRVESQLC